GLAFLSSVAVEHGGSLFAQWPKRSVVRELLAFGLPVLLSNWLYQLASLGDRLIVSARFAGPAVGQYIAASSLAMSGLMVTSAVASVVARDIARAWGSRDREEVERLGSRAVEAAGVIIAPMEIAVFLQPNVVVAL